MFSTFKILVIYLIIPSRCANCDEKNPLSLQEQVKLELSPIENSLKSIFDPLTKNDERLVQKGVILGEVKKIIERAVNAEKENKILIKDQGGLEKEKDNAMRLIIPLSIRNKATKIENRHPEIKGTIPEEVLKNVKPFEKHIIQRQYQWMELLNCNDDFYIKKLQNDLKVAYSNMESNTKETYEQFKLNFCYAIATLVEDVNKNIAHFEFEGMNQDLVSGIGDPVINPFLALFYNSVVARGENTVFNSTNVVSST